MMIEIVAAVNDDEVLRTNLGCSPDVVSGALPLKTIHDAASASRAYNDGLVRTSAEIVVFAHQDVYLPAGWAATLRQQVSRLPDTWATLGVYGVQADGRHVGCVWSQGLGRELGARFQDAPGVVALDELLLVLRRKSEITFDGTLPGFHLYGTDLVQMALDRGATAHAVCAPVVHNSLPVRRLDAGYIAAYRHLQRKWRTRLPIPTTVAAITAGPLSLARARWRRRSANAHTLRHSNCATLARSLGYAKEAA